MKGRNTRIVELHLILIINNKIKREVFIHRVRDYLCKIRTDNLMAYGNVMCAL